MSEMIERVAKAISDSRQVRAYGRVMTMWRSPEMTASFVDERLADAQSAIEAMREPTEEMLQVGGTNFAGEDRMDVAASWPIMIDAALGT